MALIVSPAANGSVTWPTSRDPRCHHFNILPGARLRGSRDLVQNRRCTRGHDGCHEGCWHDGPVYIVELLPSWRQLTPPRRLRGNIDKINDYASCTYRPFKTRGIVTADLIGKQSGLNAGDRWGNCPVPGNRSCVFRDAALKALIRFVSSSILLLRAQNIQRRTMTR